MAEKNKPIKIIVHHTANPNSAKQFSLTNLYHKERGFEKSSLGYFVGYHFFIEKDGEVKKAREETDRGQHATSENLSSIGIGLAGNFDYQYPTANQIISMCKLIDYLVKKWQIPMSEIYPHRKFKPTSCYGIMLSDDWARQKYRDYVIEHLNQLLIILKALLEKLYYYVKK